MPMAKFNRAVLAKLLAAVSETLRPLEDNCEETREYYESRTEKWQDSLKGQAYDEAVIDLEVVSQKAEDLAKEIKDLMHKIATYEYRGHEVRWD